MQNLAYIKKKAFIKSSKEANKFYLGIKHSLNPVNWFRYSYGLKEINLIN
jgi:hypothetical protein